MSLDLTDRAPSTLPVEIERQGDDIVIVKNLDLNAGDRFHLCAVVADMPKKEPIEFTGRIAGAKMLVNNLVKMDTFNKCLYFPTLVLWLAHRVGVFGTSSSW